MSICSLIGCVDGNAPSSALQRVADLDGATSARFLNDDYFVTQVASSSGESSVLLRRSADGGVVADLGAMYCRDQFDCLISAMPGEVDRLVTAESMGVEAARRRLSDGAVIRTYHWTNRYGALFRVSPEGTQFVIGPGVRYDSGEPLSPSNPSLLLSSEDGTEIASLGNLIWATFSPDGRRLFTRTMTAFEARDARTGDLVFRIEDTTPVQVSQDGGTVAFESGAIINAHSGEKISQMPQALEIAEVSPDGLYVAVREARRAITGPSATEGRYGYEGYAFIWNVRSNSVVKEFDDPLRSMSFAGGSSRLVSNYCGRRLGSCLLSITDTTTGEDVRRVALGGGFVFNDQRLLAIRQDDGGNSTVTSFNVLDGQSEYESLASARLDWGPDPARADAEFFPQNSFVLYTFIPAGGECPTLRADRLGTPSPAWERPCAQEFRAIGDNYVLVSGQNERQVLLRVDDRHEIGFIAAPNLRTIAVSPNGSTIIVPCPMNSCPGGATLWRISEPSN